MEKFAELLGQHIEASKMKQVAIASAAGITYNYLHLLLIEKRRPSDQVVKSLAGALRLSPEQTGELLASAGYAPSIALLTPSPSPVSRPFPPNSNGLANSIAHHWYRLSQEVPEHVRDQFLEEMAHLQDYMKYKYILTGGANLTDLRFSHTSDSSSHIQRSTKDFTSLNLIATLVGELYSNFEESTSQQSNDPRSSSQVEELLTALDELLGNILSEDTPVIKIQPYLSERILNALHQGVPWEIRRRVAEALSSLCQADAGEALHIMEYLRLDRDEKYGVDIRRRVIEALPALFEADRSTFPRLLSLLEPQENDDVFVALATIEACGDIQTRIKSQVPSEKIVGSAHTLALLPEQAALAKIQRQLLVNWQNRKELDVLQFSLALYHLLCSPDVLLTSIQEGLQSEDKQIQLVAVRYVERALPLRPLEALQIYQHVLDHAISRNVRRTVVRALPSLLKLMKEASLPERTSVRSIIARLAQDSDVHIRRTVSDYAMRLFSIDREFLLTLLRYLHQDRDEAIRYRLQPVVLRLAQIWLSWYAETAGLVRTSGKRKTATPFEE